MKTHVGTALTQRAGDEETDEEALRCGYAEWGDVRGEWDRRLPVSRGEDSAPTYYEGEEEPM